MYEQFLLFHPNNSRFSRLRFGEILIALTLLISLSHVMQIRTSSHFKFFMCIANIWPEAEKTATKFLKIEDNHCNCLSWDFEQRSEMLFISPLSYLYQ